MELHESGQMYLETIYVLLQKNEQVRAIVKVLNFVREADVDDEIPPTSLVREFVGGNSFYR